MRCARNGNAGHAKPSASNALCLSTCGNLITTAPAGNAYFLVGPPQTSAEADLSTMNLWDSAVQSTSPQVFPLPAFYGTRQFVVRPGEHLACVITSATNGTTYVVAGSALQYPIEAYDLDMEI